MSDYSGPYVAAPAELEIDAGSTVRSFNMSESNASTPAQGTIYSSGGAYSPASMIECQPPKPQRNRRRTVPGPEHVIHRRTRSGCYTCRSRRVKCDETRPICTRCRKGQRECTYPEAPVQSSKGSGVLAGQRDSPTSSNEDEDGTSPEVRLPSIPDEDEGSASGSRESSLPQRNLRRINTTSSLSMRRALNHNRDVSETPSQEGSANTTRSEDLSLGFASLDYLMEHYTSKPDWSHLPPAFRSYLDFYCKHITHWKYGVHKDTEDFFHTTFISLALQNQTLLYAVVSFAAFKRMLKDPDGKIHDFLQYYTHSVTLLLGLLKIRETKHDIVTLLTILQLATMEEYVGDFTNLVGHLKAAYEILTQLFTPQSIVQTSMSRLILRWYARLDLIVSAMGFSQPSLSRHWMAENVNFYQKRISHDSSIAAACDEAQAHLGLISTDMCYLNARLKAGEGTKEDFTAEHIQLTLRLRAWHDNLTDAVNLLSPAVSPVNSPSSPKLFSYFPDGRVPIFAEPFSFATANICEWHSMVLMHLCQAEQAGDTRAVAEAVARLGGDTAQHAVAICEIIDAAERWPSVPQGMLMMMQAVLGMAAMFVPRSTRHHMWFRGKFAWFESCGYIFPSTMRNRLAQLFEDETVVHWWLPKNEGFTPVLQRVRAFSDERSSNPASPETSHSRNMKKVFDSLVDLRLQDPRVEEEPVL